MDTTSTAPDKGNKIMQTITAYKYKGKIFETIEDLNIFKEKELIYSLEDLSRVDSEYGESNIRDILGLLLEYNITSKNKIKQLISKL